jgi:membrane-associated protease RseP (regulator of RpoE activity)
MLNEPASAHDDRPPLQTPAPPVAAEADQRIESIREMVGAVLAIDSEVVDDSDGGMIKDQSLLLMPGSRLLISFEGQLLIDSETAYEQLDKGMKALNLVPIFREKLAQPAAPLGSGGAIHLVHVLEGRVQPAPRSATINLVLLIATFFSVLLVGLNTAINEVAASDPAAAQTILENGFLELWRGLPYALSIMLILGGHELGHYFAARRHKVAVTLPYFLPLPFISLFGTLGAFIQLREPIRNRKVLMDIGASGPLVGLVIAIPILLIGLATSTVGEISTGGIFEGDSILYALAKFTVLGRFLPDGQQDVFVNQMAWAGWTGLFVTGLNLIPVGQLDGGHVLYALIGRQARRLFYPMLLGLAALTLFASSALWLLLILLFFFGRIHATPLDDITRLDQGRQRLALVTIVVFILVFVPAPLTQNSATNGLIMGAVMLSAAPALLTRLWQRLRSQA